VTFLRGEARKLFNQVVLAFRVSHNIRYLEGEKMMKRIVLLLAMLGVASVASAAYVETFSSGNAGWLAVTVNDSGGNTYPAATWNSTGGNTGGYITGTVSSAADRLYGLQPATASGDMTGLTLTTDYKIDGTVTGPVGAMVRFYVGTYTGGYNYFVTKDAFSWNPNADAAWTTHQVALIAANFQIWPNQNAGTKTFAQVIAAPEDIGLVFADGFTSNTTLGFTGSGTIGVDNFGTVPEPLTLSLLGLGGLALLRRKI